MIKIGMMIGDRYEILEKIGTGGMSDVYKAKCHKLNRYVAVKVLKQEFSENENFVSKFRIEAQAAAGLMHPNIVNVYDVGEENGIHYIVMELVEGITLKKYIEKKARLSYKEAVSIAIQVSMGIEAAHKNHIIHRDIKPQNVIISKDGKVKVTDFGIAKAATSNTITSNVMGSVHYTSPEQARGGYSDEKSDIYSLGITMFEMSTGRVPIRRESTGPIAFKHIQEEFPSPKEYVPEIPAAVESIVMKCCQKSPDRRYQSMSELIADLKQSLLNPDDNFVVMNDPEMEGGTRTITDSDIARIKRRSNYPDRDPGEHEDTMRLAADVNQEYEEDMEDEDDYDYDPKMERMTTALAVIAGIIICVIIVILATKLFGGNRSERPNNSPIQTQESSTEESQTAPEFVKMPNVAGLTDVDAQGNLTALGLRVELTYEESDSIPAGQVISANVSAGSQIEVGSTVTLLISAGSQGVEVPSVTELTWEEANNSLLSLGFLVNKVENYSDTVEAGFVISQTPAQGNKAPKGSVITVTVSLGKDKVRVPNLMGLTEQDGIIEVTEAGLEIGSISYVYSEEVSKDLICYQSSSHGSYVEPGTTIDIKVSLGIESVTYKCETIISAPTTSEAPDYVSGTEVAVNLTTDGGQVLLDTKYSSFPQAANYYGLKDSGGTLTMTYTVTTPSTTTTNPETGEVTTVPGTTQTKSFTRRIDFARE